MVTIPAARLLVLVPGGDLPVVELAQRLWKLAAEAGSAVLLVGLAERPDQEPMVRRSLTLLEAHTRYEPVPVSTRVARGPDWIAAVKQLWRRGDHVVCFSNQVAPAGRWSLGRQPLARALEAELKVPALVISDVALPALRRASPLRRASWWALNLAVVAVFFAAQAWLQTGVGGAAADVLLMLSIGVEFALLGALHQWRIRE